MRVLISGGARSGKSAFAEAYAAHLGTHGIYLATAQMFDDEMRERIALHRSEREASGFSWATVEEPFDLVPVLRALSGSGDVVLVDCLTLWLSNWFLKLDEGVPIGPVEQKVEELSETVGLFQGTLLLVTNEVGAGIVPDNPLARRYRDMAGKMNRRLAQACDQLFQVTAGVPVELKSRAFRFGDT